MNTKKAKKLRQQIYGGMSLKIRSYARKADGSLVNTGLRAMYLKAKKEGK